MKARYLTVGEAGAAAAVPPGPTPAAWLLRPYLDLGGDGGPVHARATASLGGTLLDDGVPERPFQGNTHSELRPRLLDEVARPAYDVDWPADLPDDLRSPGWEALVEGVASWAAAPPLRRLKVVGLLNRLGLWHATLRLVPAPSEADLAHDDQVAALALPRVVAAFKVGGAAVRDDVERTFAALATRAGGPPSLRLSAAVNLVVHHAKLGGDPIAVARWAEVAAGARAAVDAAGTGPGAGTGFHAIAASAYLRGVSYVPFLDGRPQEAAAMLDDAEALAREALADPAARLHAEENLHAVLETRSKEALAARELDLALQRATALTDHDPLDAKVWLQRGDVEAAAGSTASALGSYRRAARLGAPATGAAWRKAGTCWERLGDQRAARDAFLRAVDADARDLAALLGAHRSAKALADVPVLRWATSRLQDLTGGRAVRRAPVPTAAPA